MRATSGLLHTLLLCVCLAAPTPSFSACSATPGEPCPSYSQVPCGLTLVGDNGGVAADPFGDFSIVLRDGYGDPIVGADVWIDFSACCNDIHLSSAQYGPGMTLGPGKTIHAITVSGGVAKFRIMGAAGASGSTPGGGCAELWAQNAGAPILITDGSAHSSMHVGCYDLDGAVPGGAGVGPADLSLWESDFFASLDPSRSDYDYTVLCIRSISPADLAKWQQVFFAAGSVGNGPSFVSCP